jgi:hypothetical protein
MSEQKLPENPGEMPVALWNSEHWMRNAMMRLDKFRNVNIEWTLDIGASSESGEACGEWDVSIITSGGKEIRAKHYEFPNAIWFALEHAENFQSEYWEKRDALRAAALAKLTDEERRVLRI